MLPLLITVAPSRRQRAATLGLHALAGLALAWAHLPMPALSFGAALVLASAAMRLLSPLPRVLRCDRDGSLHQRDGDTWRPLTLLPSSMVLPALTVLHVGDGRRRSTIVILSDSLPPEDFRRLRIWLRWLARVGPDAGPATA